MAVRSGNAGATDADEPLGEMPAGSFTREDEERDERFYDVPRFVQHIDEGAIAAVTETIRRYVPPGAEVLDLMSSWVSHLPPAAELPLGLGSGDSRAAPISTRFQVLKQRWLVERTFAWLGRYRRLSKDYEGLLVTEAAWIYLAMSNLLVRRLAQ